jgi:hypothetical protein
VFAVAVVVFWIEFSQPYLIQSKSKKPKKKKAKTATYRNAQSNANQAASKFKLKDIKNDLYDVVLTGLSYSDQTKILLRMPGNCLGKDEAWSVEEAIKKAKTKKAMCRAMACFLQHTECKSQEEAREKLPHYYSSWDAMEQMARDFMKITAATNIPQSMVDHIDAARAALALMEMEDAGASEDGLSGTAPYVNGVISWKSICGNLFEVLGNMVDQSIKHFITLILLNPPWGVNLKNAPWDLPEFKWYMLFVVFH